MKKLALKKQVIATLNKSMMSGILGGETVVHPVTYENCETRLENNCETGSCIASFEETQCRCISQDIVCEISRECDFTMVCGTNEC